MNEDQKADRLASALIAIVRSSHVGRGGKPVTRSKYCNYPACLYHEAQAVIAEYAADVPIREADD